MKDIETIIADLMQQRVAIDHALEALQGVAGGGTPAKKKRGRPPGQKSLTPKKRRISPEGKQRIAEAARKRWAAVKAAKAGK